MQDRTLRPPLRLWKHGLRYRLCPASCATGVEDLVDEVPTGPGAAADTGQEHSGSEEDAAALAPHASAVAPAAAAAAPERHSRGTCTIA